MFRIILQPRAIGHLRELRRRDAVIVMDAIERFLQHEPDRPTQKRIKRLRGQEDATFRLRVRDFRVFYDVEGEEVSVVAVLHKRETAAFYDKEKP
jgi:mRNA-degrading endonuclease RelE of RelBE toxin-antitoxin system